MPRKLLDPNSKPVKLAIEIVDVWRAALSVPMEKPPTEEQKEFVRRELWPTNYPEGNLIIMLGRNGKRKPERTTRSDATSEPAPGAASSAHQG